MPSNLPFTEAIQSQESRRILPTDLRSDMLQQLPPQVRAHARFSAAMTSGEYLRTVDSTLQSVVAGQMDSATALLELDKSLGSLGYPSYTGKRGPITEHRGHARRKLILDTTTAQAGNYGQWVQGNTDTARDLYPAWEYHRAVDAREPRDWESRWLAAAGRLFGGRMIALKDDPIWLNPALNRLGTPYPPFDFGSGMRLRPIGREEAESLGLIGPDEDVLPPFEEFRAESRAAAGWDQSFRSALESAMGDVAEFQGNVFRLKPEPTWQDRGLQPISAAQASAMPPEMDPAKARRALEQGEVQRDHTGAEVKFDRSVVDHWEGRDGSDPKSAKEIESRLARLPWAKDTVAQPFEHWRDNTGTHRYMKVYGEGRNTRGVMVVVKPGGSTRTYFVGAGRLRSFDGSRKGTLITDGGDE